MKKVQSVEDIAVLLKEADEFFKERGMMIRYDTGVKIYRGLGGKRDISEDNPGYFWAKFSICEIP